MGKFHYIRKSKQLKGLIGFRDLFMTKTGLFKLKAYIKQKIFFASLILSDAKKKMIIKKNINSMQRKAIDSEICKDDIIFSVTSYGKRVKNALPYMLYSVINQTVSPKKVIVYLDEKKWNNNNIPSLLQKLRSIGIEVHYCEDIKSFTKLIPALKEFPDNPIVTLDDDLYYNPRFIQWITEAYNKSDKKTILGQWGCIPEKKDSAYIPYNEWKDCKYGDEHSPISFFGCRGCCYPPHIFDDEIFKKEIFLKLCPTADDIWFWAMEERQNINRAYIKQKGNSYHTSVNRIEEYDWSQKGTLMHQNVVGGKNNEQLIAVVEYYHL